jgi:hypothetical protein
LFRFVETLCEDQDFERYMSCVHCLSDYFLIIFTTLIEILMGSHTISLVWTIFFTLVIEKGYDNSWNKSIPNLFEILLICSIKIAFDERVLKKAQLPRFLLILSLQMKFSFGFDQPTHISLCIYQIHELSPFSSSYLLYFIIIFKAVAGDSSCLKWSFFTLLITSDYSQWEKSS